VCADDGAVDDRRCVVDFYLQLAEDLRPDVLTRPVAKPVVDALPAAEAFRKITPLDAGARAEDDGIDKEAVAARRLAALRAARQQRLKFGPLGVGQRVPVHRDLGSRRGSPLNILDERSCNRSR